MFCGSGAFAETVAVESPDGHLKFTIEVTQDGVLTHALALDGKPLISPSPVGFDGGHLVAVKRHAENSVWKPVWGRRAVVPDRYRDATIDLCSYQLKARAYDEGIAFRYVFPGAKPSGAEATSFNHNFVVRWAEVCPKGRFEWPNSDVVHAICDDPTVSSNRAGNRQVPKRHRLSGKGGTWIIYPEIRS